MRSVLVTRAEPGATRTTQRLAALGYRAVNAATARIAFLDATLDLASDEMIALTSPNGAEAAARLTALRSMPVFAVGAATADAARAQGFTDVLSADGDGLALAKLIAARTNGPVLHVHGRDIRFDLVSALTLSGVRARGVTAYAAEPTTALNQDASASLAAGAVVLVYSPKGAERLVALARKAGATEALLQAEAAAISNAAAEPLEALGIARVEIAAHPDEAALIDALERLLR